MKRRILRMALVMLMVIGLMPVAGQYAYAASTEDTMPWLQFNDAHDTITGYNYQAASSPSEITIPATHTDGTVITAIGEKAFYGAGLTKVEFEAGSALTTLGNFAFEGNLFAEINMPLTVTTLGSGCFQNCSKLTKIDLSGYNIEDIPAAAFYNCGSLETVILPENLKTIGSNAFMSHVNSLTGTIKIPASVTSIGNYAFYYAKCTLDLTEHAPGSIPGQPWNAYYSYVKWKPNGDSSCFVFNSDTGLLCGLKAYNAETGLHEDGTLCSDKTTHTEGKVVIPKAIENNKGVSKDVVAINSGAFMEATGKAVITSLSFESGSCVESIGNFAFYSCFKLLTVTLPESLSVIANNAFGYTSIQSIVIPSNVKSLGASAFVNCSKLSEVTIGDESNGSALKDLKSLATLFSSTKTLTTINVPGNTEDSLPDAPWGANYASIKWKDKTTPPLIVLTEDGNWEFNTKTKVLAKYLGPTGSDVDLVIPEKISYKLPGSEEVLEETITIIGDSALANCKSFASVTLPSTIEKVGYASFQNTTIGKLKLNEGLKEIGSTAFANCGLTEVDFPDSLGTIGSYAFMNNQLTTLSLNEGLKFLSTHSFANNKIKGDVKLPSSLISIQGGSTGSFEGNDGITSFHVMQGRKDIVPAASGHPELPKATDTIIGAAPFGVPGCANQIYYADDPQPIPGYTVEKDVVNNKAIIKLSVPTNDYFTIIKEILPGTEMPDVSNVSLQEEDGKVPSTADMVVSDNGSYSFIIRFGSKSTSESKDYIYSDPVVDCFHGVTYSANSGSLDLLGSAPSDAAPYVEGYGLKVAGSGSMEITGYTFGGWNTQADGKGTTYQSGDTLIMPDEDVTLYAVWNVNSYNVTFNMQGHGTAPAAETIKYGKKITEPAAPIATGYTFGGWYKEAVCTNAWVFSSDTMPAEDVTLYALWTADSFNVTFSANGHGTAPAAETVKYGEKVQEPTAPTETGYTFIGWYKEADCSNAWSFGADTMPAESITLYAKWQINSYNVTYNMQGHGTAPAAETVKYGEKVTEPADPTDTGYTFGGWYKDTNCTTPWNFRTDTMPAEDVTLYAKWTA
ncbi:MAG: leucine-rich repeat protein, partial [Lachnospiraceae bacterium]|nr:leucine-rich repeat protein [Lachnospiraceae bacterium]